MESNNPKTFPFPLDGISRKGLLEAKDIKNMDIFFAARNLFCDCKNVRRDTLHFALKCITDIINQPNHLKLIKKNSPLNFNIFSFLIKIRFYDWLTQKKTKDML